MNHQNIYLRLYKPLFWILKNMNIQKWFVILCASTMQIQALYSLKKKAENINLLMESITWRYIIRLYFITIRYLRVDRCVQICVEYFHFITWIFTYIWTYWLVLIYDVKRTNVNISFLECAKITFRCKQVKLKPSHSFV